MRIVSNQTTRTKPATQIATNDREQNDERQLLEFKVVHLGMVFCKAK